ncbi:MAG: hypothetical protein HC880_13620 [Bacteroidia bacterium]|nr:hypothetical protein [Bacteroidia bacterium]
MSNIKLKPRKVNNNRLRNELNLNRITALITIASRKGNLNTYFEERLLKIYLAQGFGKN